MLTCVYVIIFKAQTHSESNALELLKFNPSEKIYIF